MTVQAGMVAVSDPRVRGIYKDIKDARKELFRPTESGSNWPQKSQLIGVR